MGIFQCHVSFFLGVYLFKGTFGNNKSNSFWTNHLAKLQYFTNLDFSEIRGFTVLSYLLGWGRVRSVNFDQNHLKSHQEVTNKSLWTREKKLNQWLEGIRNRLWTKSRWKSREKKKKNLLPTFHFTGCFNRDSYNGLLKSPTELGIIPIYTKQPGALFSLLHLNIWISPTSTTPQIYHQPHLEDHPN